MRMFYFSRNSGELAVIHGKYRFLVPAYIDLNSRYARERIKNGRTDIIGCYHLEQSTCKKAMLDFTDKIFYKLGKQLAKL